MSNIKEGYVEALIEFFNKLKNTNADKLTPAQQQKNQEALRSMEQKFGIKVIEAVAETKVSKEPEPSMEPEVEEKSGKYNP